MKGLIEIPDSYPEILENIKPGSIADHILLTAVRVGKPYKEQLDMTEIKDNE